MRVLVVGANGQIGSQVATLLKENNNHSPLAMIRDKDQADKFKKESIETTVADLEGSVDHLAEAAKGCEAVIFAAGSGGGTGADKTLLIDLDGAIKMVHAAEKAGVERFLIVSALQAHNRDNWNEQIKHYYVAKHYADEVLLDSKLSHTIVRPGGLTNDEATGKIQAAKDLGMGQISRSDVAKTLVAALDEKNTINKDFDLLSGDEEIATVLSKL
ncbi:SDR family oxidoreductase [Halalkalibacillus halophilus]|uniref:SDR family oxidoreductase n=1 Tax=Halalkalibacillus halophilus TaxID=392827 RepID=UPI00040F4F73|nr:SDR family oxidoreductase [Halalkalibacillus halophilus]